MMKLRYVLVIVVLALVGGFTIGQFLPISYLKPDIIDKQISLNDLYARIFSIFGTFVTFMAVIVALFKEEIRKLWEYAHLTIEFRDDICLMEVMGDNNSKLSSSENNIIAEKYETVLTTTNKGKISAKNCEVYLERLYCKNINFPDKQSLTTTGSVLKLNGKDGNLIVTKAKAQLSIIEIISSSEQAVSSSNNTKKDNKPQIKIGDIIVPVHFNDSTFEATFMLHSDNANTIEYILEIAWNGKWENRLTEMTKYISIKPIIKAK